VPDVFDSFGKGLHFDGAVGMTGVAGEDELVVVALGLEGGGHALVGHDPVVQGGLVAGGAVVVLADLEPDADGPGGALGDELGVYSQAPRGDSGFLGDCWST